MANWLVSEVVTAPTWDHTFDNLRELASHPSAAPWLGLLREAQPKWERKVAVKASILDFIWFHRLGEAFPWETVVHVSYTEGEMEFQLKRDRRLVITADGATPGNAYAVLDAFLMQLTGTT